MPKALRLYIVGVATLSALALGAATLSFPATAGIALVVIPGSSTEPANIFFGVLFWTTLTLVASALPVKLPRGTQQAVAMAPILAAITLGGPAVGGWVAAIGSTEMREVRGRIPWYGTIANHAGLVFPAVIAGIARLIVIGIADPKADTYLIFDLAATMAAAAVFFLLNASMAGALLALRTEQPIWTVVSANTRETASNNLPWGHWVG